MTEIVHSAPSLCTDVLQNLRAALRFDVVKCESGKWFMFVIRWKVNNGQTWMTNNNVEINLPFRDYTIVSN